MVLTGFLGSGKTTLLKRFLASAEGEGSGVVVNEFGEVGVDQDLLVHNAEDIQLISAGRARLPEVSRALHEIVRRSKVAGGAKLTTIFFETSGLADPSVIVAALAEDPWLRTHIDLVTVIAVVDAVAGPRNIELFPEARQQLAVCDTAVVTKTDLRSACPLSHVHRHVAEISPDIRVLDSQSPEFNVVDLFCSAPTFGGPQPSDRPAETSTEDISSFVLPLEEPVDWPVFTLWLSALLHSHGQKILRVKGLLRTSASGGVLAIHGVQHIMHPPVHLPADSMTPRSSQLVFITRGLARQEIGLSYRRFSSRFAPRPRLVAEACL
ncbi:GTP-binding protein [Mesorhizobium sp. J428]|uniref:CobW family GTP-binding protein n=1 Tax=Mesorhizobium sp. J428 TaxID=2898440 RepID=UPI002150FAA2|nr:GTP-binding protein [Mesorhizobium sp. J428]MCR5857208.1 GTP-binding protein [Mesorhizobium sp. J428]